MSRARLGPLATVADEDGAQGERGEGERERPALRPAECHEHQTIAAAASEPAGRWAACA